MTKLSALALPILALAACAPSTDADADDDPTTESSVTIGPGEGAATVTLHMPAGYDPHVAEFDAQFELSVNGTVVTPDKPTKVSWNAGGNGPLTCITGALKSAQATHAVMSDCSIHPLQKNETRTITMSLLKLWWSNYPQAWANYVSHYATEKVTLEHEGKGISWSSESGWYAFLGRNGIAMPVVAGTYRYKIGEGVFAPIRFAVAEGAVADVNVGYDAYNTFVELSFEDRGGFPNAPTPSLWLKCLGDTRTIVRPDGAAKQTVTILDPLAAGACSVTAGLFEQTVTYARAATTNVQFRRLNVDDVELFDGTKSHGRYRVRRKDSGKLSPWNPTGTGLDLLPGEYQLEIWYQNETRHQITDVDLR